MNLLYFHKEAEECRHTFTINQGEDINSAGIKAQKKSENKPCNYATACL